MTMTPEQITAALSAFAVVITAIGGLVVTIHSVVKKVKSDVGDIKTATNGVAAHQEKVRETLVEEVSGLKTQLAEVVAAALASAEAARQAAADVRAERAAPPPKPEGGQ